MISTAVFRVECVFCTCAVRCRWSRRLLYFQTPVPALHLYVRIDSPYVIQARMLTSALWRSPCRPPPRYVVPPTCTLLMR